MNKQLSSGELVNELARRTPLSPHVIKVRLDSLVHCGHLQVTTIAGRRLYDQSSIAAAVRALGLNSHVEVRNWIEELSGTRQPVSIPKKNSEVLNRIRKVFREI